MAAAHRCQFHLVLLVSPHERAVSSAHSSHLDGITFFTSAGIHNPFLINVATNIVNTGMTLPGIWAVDRFGRRALLLWGAVLMCVCEFLVAIIGVTISINNIAGQRALISIVCIYVGTFAATWGPVAWVVTGEIFPLNVRAKGISLSAASNWCAFICSAVADLGGIR